MMVRGIDIHVYIPVPVEMLPERARERSGAMARYFGTRAAEQRPMDVDALADSYRQRDMMAVLLITD